MNASKKLLIHGVEVELLLLDHGIKHPVFFQKGPLGFDLGQGPLEVVLLLVLQLDYDRPLGLPRWHLIYVAVELLGFVQVAPACFKVHNCPQLKSLRRELSLPQGSLVLFQEV